MRDRGVEHARNLLERMGEVSNQGVIGIGIGGFEPGFPPELFEATFERARALGFRTTAHAGEAAGAASVWGAVRALRVDRIGQPRVRLRIRSLSSTLPPGASRWSFVRFPISGRASSNPSRRTRCGSTRRGHSGQPQHGRSAVLRQFARHGVRDAQRAHRFTRDEIRRLMLSSIEATWLSADRKRRLAEDFQRDPSWNETGA